MKGTSPTPTLLWGVLVVVASVTGFVGWLFQGAGPANAVYQTAQLFLLEFPEDLELHPVLEFGRFLAAAATGATLFAIGFRVVVGRWQRSRIARLRGHTVVIGCGHTGATILESLHREDGEQDLLAIDLSQEALEQVAHLDVHVLQGDGRVAALLQKAKVERARRIIVAVEDWGPATGIARTVAEGAPGVPILTHLDDLTLLHRLRLDALADPDEPGEVFNLHENAARALLSGYDDRLAGGEIGPSRIVLVGGGQVAEAVIVHATYAWLASLREFPLRIQLVGERSSTTLAGIVGRWPELTDQLSCCTVDTSSPMRYATDGGIRSDDLVIVDLEDADHAVAVGAAIRAGQPDVAPVVLGRNPPGRGMRGVQIRDLASLAWTPNILDADSLWQLAYSLHETYRQGVMAATSPNGVSWEELTVHIQADNRRAVIHMLGELNRHGCRLALASREHIARPVEQLATIIEPGLREQLASSEHARWVADRRRSPDAPQRHDQVWGELDEGARDWTRTTVATWPRLLLRLGYQVDIPTDDAAAGRLLTVGASYRRIGEDVRAERVEAATIWRTDGGDEMRAAEGDWLLERSDGSRWSVSDEALHLTYDHLGDDRYRPTGIVQAVQLDAPARVRSPEGDVSGRIGDWLVRNALGDVWIVGAKTFAQRYEPAEADSATSTHEST